jgi:hypothetical protein
MKASKDYYIKKYRCEFIEEVSDEEGNIVMVVLRPINCQNFYFSLSPVNINTDEQEPLLHIMADAKTYNLAVINMFLTNQLGDEYDNMEDVSRWLDFKIPGDERTITLVDKNIFYQ